MIILWIELDLGFRQLFQGRTLESINLFLVFIIVKLQLAMGKSINLLQKLIRFEMRNLLYVDVCLFSQNQLPILYENHYSICLKYKSTSNCQYSVNNKSKSKDPLKHSVKIHTNFPLGWSSKFEKKSKSAQNHKRHNNDPTSGLSLTFK